MDELVDVLDENGIPTGEAVLKSEAHKKGLFHPIVHVWFYTKDGKVLLQQRSKTKDTHPLLWDVSVAGHIASGEPILDAAQREVWEEIGLRIEETALKKIGVFKSEHRHSEELVDREFHHNFIAELQVPLSGLKKQESEVEALQLMPLLQFAEEVWGLANTSNYVPHGSAYYREVIKAIKQQLAAL